jgi:hypothetical protein
MSTIAQAKLTNVDTLAETLLPLQFSYQPLSPKKRKQVVQTVGDIKIHTAPTIVGGDSLLQWRLTCATRAEWFALLSLYNDADSPSFTFEGYWGDECTVKLFDMNDAEVRSRLFNLTGSFQVVAVASYGTAS